MIDRIVLVALAVAAGCGGCAVGIQMSLFVEELSFTSRIAVGVVSGSMITAGVLVWAFRGLGD